MNKQGTFQNIFRSFKHRNFRLFFSGQSFSLVGTWIQNIATAWLVYRLTNSAFLLGFAGFSSQIPSFFFGPFGGVLSDRWNRYHIILATQTLAMLQAFVLTFLFFSGTIQVWHIIALNAFLGFVNSLDIPTRQSFIIDMVGGNKEDLGNAIALNSSMVNGARLLGPSLAGLMIAASGEGFCFLVNGISYIFVLTSLILMKVKLRESIHRNSAIWQQLKDGFKYTFGFAPIKAIILLLGLISLMGMPYAVLMPVYVKTILHGNSHTFGFLIGASGIGALCGAFYLASRKSVLGLGNIIPISAGIFSTGLILFSFSTSFILSIFLVIAIGFGMMLQMASGNTILQTIVDDDKRGRAMSFYLMAFTGTIPIGSFLAGSLASAIGVPATLQIGGSVCLIGAIIFASRLKELKKVVHPIYVKLGIIKDINPIINLP